MSDVRQIPISRIHPFKGQPYNVTDNEEMDALAESILKQGVLSPVIVRPTGKDEYEMVSGHRRLRASQIAGFTTIPAFVCEMDRDQAAIVLVDSNLHRDHLLPSEKAFAYRLKLEAIRHQGKHLENSKCPSAELISPIDSGRNVQRLIRLTYLIPELLKLVDEDVMAFTPAVNLSYLTDEEQHWVYNEILRNDCTPSLAQSVWLKERSIDETLSREQVIALAEQEKPNQRESIHISRNKLKGVIPDDFSASQTEDFIIKACEFYSKHLNRHKEAKL